MEAWLWDVESFKQKLGFKKRLSPSDMRDGTNLLNANGISIL
jgi:hypothetical protein